MSTMTGPPGTGWRVVSQNEEIGIGPDNRAADGVRVFFATQYGTNGSVWVPRVTYSPDMVRQAITETAANMDAVHTLSG